MFERWQSLPPNKVKLDAENNVYIIPLDIGSRIEGEIILSKKNNAKIVAAEILFAYLGIPRQPNQRFLNSDFPDERSFEEYVIDVGDFVESFTNPERTNQNTRALISFPVDIVSEEISILGAENPDESTISSTTPPQRIIAEAFHSDEIHSLVRSAQNNIQYFNVRARNFKGTIKNLSFEEDINDLGLIVPKIKTFLMQNKIVFSNQKAQTLEFQFDGNFKLKRFLIALEDGTTREPKIGLNDLSTESPFSSYRIMNYFLFLKHLADNKTKSLTLMDFIATFVKPDPAITYDEQSAIDKVKELQRQQKKEEDECKGIVDTASGLYEGIGEFSQDPLGAIGAYTKDYITLAQAHAEAIENKSDSTEFHPVLGKNIRGVINKISTAADLYEEWWNKADATDVALKLLQCLGVELPTDICLTPTFPKPNTMGFNENSPIIDWTEGFAIDLENSLSTFLADTILNVAKGLLNELDLKEVCETALSDIFSENPSFSGDDEADLSISATIAVTMAGSRSEKTLSKSARDFFEIGDGEDLSSVKPGKYEILRQELIVIIEDLFLVLTNEEICRLFRGESNDKDIFYIQSLVKTKYANSPALFLFETKTSIIDTFSQLGKEIDLSFCEIELSEDVQNMKIYDLCTIKSDLIDDSISPKQLDSELEKLRRAKREQIERLKDIIENGFSQDTTPPALCTVGENGEKIPGLVNEPATSAYMINNAVDASFENIYMSFGSEAEQWKDNFITIEDQRKQVDVLIPFDSDNPDDPTRRVNPQVQILISQGQPSEQFYDEVLEDGKVIKQEKLNNKTEITRKRKTPADNLLQTLNNERANPFEIKSTEDSVYFQLDIPGSPENQSLSSLLAEIKALQVPKGIPESAFDKITDTIVAACSKENEGKLTGAAIENLIDDLGSMNDIRKVFNAASLLNRPDLFELGNIRYSLRFAQEKIDKNIENFEGYKKSNYISIIANLKDDESNDVEYEIVRFYGDDVDSELGEVLDTLDAPNQNDLNPDNSTFESIAFAKYCLSIWENNGFEFLAKDIVNQVFANNYYYDVLGFIDSYMLEKIIDSPFFNIQKFEAIDLNPQRTQREIKCNIQNNLLIIDNNKQKIIDDYNKNKCDRRDLIINGKPNPDKLNPFDLALLKQQVLTLIRLYTIDYCLRGVFPVSVFKKDSSIENDRTFIAFIYEMMTDELKSLDDNFYMSFENLCLDIYLEANDGAPPPVSETDYKEYAVNSSSEDEFLRKILEPRGDSSKIDTILAQEELDENEIKQSLQIQNAIKFLIKDQISNVYEKILLALNSAGIPELKEQFLMSLPETFVAKDVENDTFRYLNDLLKNIKDEGSIESLKNILFIAARNADQSLDFGQTVQAIVEKYERTGDIEQLKQDVLNLDVDPDVFNLIESEASKLPLASKFFVEKYCVVEDYSQEELEAKIEEARGAEIDQTSLISLDRETQEEVGGFLQNLDLIPRKKLAIIFEDLGSKRTLFTTIDAHARLVQLFPNLASNFNNQTDDKAVFDNSVDFFKAIYDFISNKDPAFLNEDKELSELLNSQDRRQPAGAFQSVVYPQKADTSRDQEVVNLINMGFENYRKLQEVLQVVGLAAASDNRTSGEIAADIFGRSPSLKDVVSPEALANFLQTEKLQTYKISSIFKSLKYGARLIFLPDDEFKYNNWIDQTNEASEQIEKLKLFNLSQSQGNQILTKHPFAVAKYEIDSTNIIFDASDEDIKISDLTILQMLGPDDDPLFYNRYKRQLLRGLKQSRGYKFLFDYAFSLYDLSSFYTIFSSITASKKQGVPINWDGTKAALILLIMMTNNRGRYDHISSEPLLNDPTEFAKAFDKAFDILQSCGSLLPCNLINLGGLSSLGFAMKFAIKTPKLIFKGLTELIDPNIGLAVKIKCVDGSEVPLEWMSSILEFLQFKKTPLGVAYLLLFGGDFDFGVGGEFETGNLIDIFSEDQQSSAVRGLSSDCDE